MVKSKKLIKTAAKKKGINSIPAKTLKELYETILRIRRFEEKIIEVYPAQEMKTPVHLCIGEEAIAAGVCIHLRKDDYVFSTHRSHGHSIAKGSDMKRMMAEFYGRKTGCSKGKGGSMHLCDPENGILGSTAIVGGGIPIAVGAALASFMKGTDTVSVAFFGDGAMDEGTFHESMNFAALKRIPVLFICENNFYAIHSHHLSRHHSDNIWERVKGYGMPSYRIEDSDIFKIYEFTKRHVKKMRNGESGPVFLECITSRWKEHVGTNEDFHLGYRCKDEVGYWIENDPIKKVSSLLNSKIADEIESEIEQEIKEAFQFAEVSPFPDAEELYKDIFKE